LNFWKGVFNDAVTQTFPGRSERYEKTERLGGLKEFSEPIIGQKDILYQGKTTIKEKRDGRRMDTRFARIDSVAGVRKRGREVSRAELLTFGGA